MHVLIAIGALFVTILFFVLQANWAVRETRELNRDTRFLQHRVRNRIGRIIGTKLSRVRDPQLAAAILMIQLVRTGPMVTAEEKTEILRQLGGPIGVADPQAMVERAWPFTQNRVFFSTVADELVPMLHRQLTVGERTELVEALRAVAGAYGEPSELQTGAIVRLRKSLG